MAKQENQDEVAKAIVKLRESEAGISDDPVRRYVPTGITAVDFGILKRGGLPDGRIIEIYGATGAAKSILAAQIMGNKQRMDKDGRLIYVIDTEYSFDRDFARNFGLNTDPDRCVVKRTNIAEEAINLAIEAVESGAVCGLDIDSIGNFESTQHMGGKRFEIDKKSGKYKSDQPGVIAKLTGGMARRLAHAAYENECIVVGVNHLHPRIAQTFSPTAGEERSGGKKWEYNRHVSLRMSRIKDLKRGELVIGLESKVTVNRSKVSTSGSTEEGQHARFWFEGYTVGRTYEAFDSALILGVITQSGSSFKWTTQAVTWRGRAKALEELTNSEDMLARLEAEVASKASSLTLVGSIDQMHEEELD